MPDRTSAPQIEFLGVRFNLLPADRILNAVLALAGDSTFSYVVTPNVDHVVRLHGSQGERLGPALDAADLVICDSRILARLAVLSGCSMPLMPGSDLTRDLLGAVADPMRIAIIGGDAALHARIADDFPIIDWQFHEPPMGVLHNAKARADIARFVVESGADIILFAIGAPQSEIVCQEIKADGRARGVALCIGASLEFLIGAKQRAPRWMQRAGLEWLFRLLSEPRRLWRRYLIEGPKIFPIWWRWNRRRSHPRAGSGSSRAGG